VTSWTYARHHTVNTMMMKPSFRSPTGVLYVKRYQAALRKHFKPGFKQSSNPIPASGFKRIRALLSKASDFKSFTGEKRKMIAETFESEFSLLELGEYKFTIGSSSISFLPATIYEERLAKHLNVLVEGNEASTGTFEEIVQLEASIKSSGYNTRYPVLVEVHPLTSGDLELLLKGGNHRVQAVRNLIMQGHLPSSFKIPTIFVFDKGRIKAIHKILK